MCQTYRYCVGEAIPVFIVSVILDGIIKYILYAENTYVWNVSKVFEDCRTCQLLFISY